MTADVQGYCPMGCGTTLRLGSAGFVTCSSDECPNATAASVLLLDSETEHIVVFEPGTFSLQHPLRERLNGELFACPIHQAISAMDGPPVQPGRYRARRVNGRISWEPLETTS